MGVSDLPLCKPSDIVCQIARRTARAGVYSAWAQKNLVQVSDPSKNNLWISSAPFPQAQYYRDPDQFTKYIASNKFMTSINNEIQESVNKTYAQNLASLSNLVLILFSDDRTVVPKESSWFGSYVPLVDDDAFSGSHERSIIPMRLQPTYLADTFGLRTLDEKGGVRLEICSGEHMQISDDCWRPLVLRYVGGALESKFS